MLGEINGSTLRPETVSRPFSSRASAVDVLVVDDDAPSRVPRNAGGRVAKHSRRTASSSFLASTRAAGSTPTRFANSCSTMRNIGFLFVNDGSTDGTPRTARRACSQSERLSCTAPRAQRRQGRSGAPGRAGGRRARRSVRGLLGRRPRDAAGRHSRVRGPSRRPSRRADDLRRPGAGFSAVRSTAGRCGIISGASSPPPASLVLGVPLLRHAVRRQAVSRVVQRSCELFETPFRSRWIFDVEIVARFLCEPHSVGIDSLIHEEPLQRWRDVAGSKVRPRDFVRALFELWTIGRAYRRAGPGRASRPTPCHARGGRG